MANAEDSHDFYAAFKGEAAFLTNSAFRSDNITGELEYDAGYGMGGAIGYYLKSNIRTELELVYRANDASTLSVNNGPSFELEDSAVNTFNTMVNGYYDIDLGRKLMPYVGAGAGVAYKVNGKREAAMAYQGMMGVSYGLEDEQAIYGGYRYVGTTKFKDNLDIDLSYHIIELGYRIGF